MKDSNVARHWMHKHPFAAFAINMIVSLAVMFLVMFSMIDGLGDFRNNLNRFYMGLTMVAPMGVLMLATMGGMYPNRKVNFLLIAAFVILFIAAFGATRAQVLIGDRQFIPSMVPHHLGAIFMCRKAALRDPELVTLCSEIMGGQRAEIDRMNAIGARLDTE